MPQRVHHLGTPAWRRYAERFADRYGEGVQVCVMELTGAERGLGYPEGFGSSSTPSEPLSPRDRALLELAGLGVVLLSRGANTALLGEILTYLVGLAKPVRVDGMRLPGWWTDTGPGGEELVGGHGNNGMAHGIAGPLALLAIARRHGAEVSGQEEAIEAFARWLERFGGAYWITRNQMSRSELPAAGPARPSWCYGALGIARARQLAALALGDTDRRQQAENLAYAALTAPEVSRLTVDACLCHGWAGLLTVTKAIASDSPGPDRFHGPINTLTEQVTTGVDALPKSGLMEGRPGAELALLNSQAVGWTRALLID